MSDSKDLRLLMARLGEALNSTHLPYMVIGGQAVNHHGRVRATEDIDITLAVSPLDWRRVQTVVDQLDLKPLVDDVHEWVLRTHVLPTNTAGSSLRIDMSFTDSPYEAQAIARGDDVIIDGVHVRFASVEDLLIHKIIAWRDVDRGDVHAILLKNPDADLDDVRHWLSLFSEALEIDLLDRLDDAIRATRDT